MGHPPEGNFSNSTATKQAFPPLPDQQGKAIWNAYLDLMKQLKEDEACRNAAQRAVFNKMPDDANHKRTSPDNFVRYLTLPEGKTPHISDGTQSSWAFKNAWCGSGWSWWNTLGGCNSPYPGTIESYFSVHSDDGIAERPSFPLTIFLRPTSIDDKNNGGINLNNEAMFFHEAIHGYTSLSDPSILDVFYGDTNRPTSDISEYLKDNVLLSCPIGRKPQ